MGYWLIFGVFMLLSLGVQWRVNSKIKTYSKEFLPSGLTGREVAEKMLHDNGIYDVKITCVEGKLIWKGNFAEGPSRNGGTWTRCQFVLRNEEGCYPEQGLFSCFGNLAERMSEGVDFPADSRLKVRFELRARSYENKEGITQWMGDCEVFHIEKLS